ncbi:Dopey, N-terminal-domain-containing protein [Pavlovales sp. CCMP2436]|nr:Dopey, N-terminal-domain-containing protein [Pavlovales sp. CCMP2436]
MAEASASLLGDDDEAALNTYKYRGVRYECEAILQAFEKAEEWADLIKYLQARACAQCCARRLQKVIQRSPDPLIVPHKGEVAKRLGQCLHADLPAGVHLKTLETYELIFEKVGAERLAKDIAFYSEGLFPLCRHASYEVKPMLLSLLEEHYVPLGRAISPMPALAYAHARFPAAREEPRAAAEAPAALSAAPAVDGPAALYYS